MKKSMEYIIKYYRLNIYLFIYELKSITIYYFYCYIIYITHLLVLIVNNHLKKNQHSFYLVKLRIKYSLSTCIYIILFCLKCEITIYY